MAPRRVKRCCYLLVRVRGNSKLPRGPLANEPDVAQSLDGSDDPFAGVGRRRSTVMDLLAIVEHEVALLHRSG